MILRPAFTVSSFLGLDPEVWRRCVIARAHREMRIFTYFPARCHAEEAAIRQQVNVALVRLLRGLNIRDLTDRAELQHRISKQYDEADARNEA